MSGLPTCDACGNPTPILIRKDDVKVCLQCRFSMFENFVRELFEEYKEK